MARPLSRCWSLVAALGLTGCMAPVLPPVRPMLALPSDNPGTELSAAMGYAASPGAGLGDAVIPGSPYAEGELRYGFTQSFQLTGGLGITFHRYFVPWPSSLTVGTKVVLYDDPDVAVAIAPRLLGASTVYATLALGAAAVFSFPRLRGSLTQYHLFLGGEELWLTQTGALHQPGPDPVHPLVSLARFSLTAGLGVSIPAGE
jgi:hypothetical protein